MGIIKFLEELEKNNWELESGLHREDCPHIEFDIKRDKEGRGEMVSICTLLGLKEAEVGKPINLNKRYYCLFDECPIKVIDK